MNLRDQFKDIKKENKFNRELKLSGGYYEMNILDEITDTDIEINIQKKKIYINVRMTYIAFLTHLHLNWYKDTELCRIRFPFRLFNTEIQQNGWEIINNENILTPSQVKKLYDEELFNRKVNESK